MTEQQIQDIVDRIAAALEGLAPGDSPWWAWLPALTPLAALIAASVAAVIGYQNLKAQQRALKATVSSNASSLRQKREADSRSEWWRRTQWALEATVSPVDTMKEYGVGLLDVLARSKLAGPEEAGLLITVLEGTSTEMKAERINQLVQDAERFEETLTPEEETSLRSFGDIDDPAPTGENEGSKGGSQ